MGINHIKQTESFRMRITETLKYRLKQAAANKGMDASKYVRDLIEQDYKQQIS